MLFRPVSRPWMPRLADHRAAMAEIPSTAPEDGYAWCCAFVSWCLTHAGAPAGSFVVEVSCPRMMKYLSEKGRYFQSETAFLPKAGDLIFFGNPNSAPNHIAANLSSSRRTTFLI